MRWYWWVSVAIALAAVVPSAWRYARLQADQPWALVTHTEHTLNPTSHDIRLRLHEWKEVPGTNFFQWWNHAIVDAVTNVSWTIAFGLSRHNGSVTASTTLLERLNGVPLAEGTDFDVIAPGHFEFSNDCDVKRVKQDVSGESRVVHSQIATPDGNRYDLKGAFVDSSGQELSYEITVHRIHGIYGGHDAERNGAADSCNSISTFYGYHSHVEGVVRSRGLVHTIDRSTRFRAYAGSTWGCYLPFGEPPIEYPWTWFWLVIPHDDPQQEIAISAGTVRYQEFPSLKVLRNAYGGSAVLDQGAMHHHVVFFKAFNPTVDLLVVGDAEPGYFVLGNVEQHDWSTVTDKFGTARVPLTQIFHFASSHLELKVTVRVKEGEYFRIPFQRNHYIYSDFRANGVRAHVHAVLKAGAVAPGSPARTLYNDWIVSPFSAVEYAYADPYPATAADFDVLYAPLKLAASKKQL